ncbi:MAG TPA: ACT domain-containing protein, partial [Candidatus Atribacteria bacterium]|nr:ACT domain-containing protein [Candidatus Atribacteria bacterium]HQE25140.1 ACT domain-containing protein [Candidatus Atribacteria bacterium]
CCTPVPGDQIVAFVTKGKGITIHRVDCPNLNQLSQDGERFLEASWGEEEGTKYHAGVVIEALDRPKLLADVSNTISNFQVGIKSVRASTMGNEARIYLLLEVKDRKELDNIFREVGRIANVRSVRRGGVFALR